MPHVSPSVRNRPSASRPRSSARSASPRARGDGELNELVRQSPVVTHRAPRPFGFQCEIGGLRVPFVVQADLARHMQRVGEAPPVSGFASGAEVFVGQPVRPGYVPHEAVRRGEIPERPDETSPVSDLTEQRDALFESETSVSEITLDSGQNCGAVERVGTGPGGCILSAVEGQFDEPLAFAQVSAHPPVVPQRRHQSQLVFDLAPFIGPAQRRAQVVLFQIELVHRVELAGPEDSGLELFGATDEKGRVPGAHGG